ncbi:hypothetical protein DFS34DRAFT_652571 [Phlyctochytrium arcticum]|nr:hypothetical protein DFS34DRAFT_652571 [Phlyctochytrium arcticum]
METQYSNTDPDLCPTPRKLASYLKQHDVFDGKGLLDAWMELTTGIEDIAAAVMQMCGAKKSISIDATGKFPSKIGVKEKGTDNWITPTEMNSESHDNLGPCFEKVLAIAKEECWAPTADRPLFLITDNANSLKNLVRDKMPHFIIKQDPWHLINSDIGERTRVGKALHAALYTDDGDMRTPAAAAKDFRDVCNSVQSNSVSESARAKWDGTVQKNALLIEEGYLFDEGSNTYIENNQKIKLIHTKLTNRRMGPQLAMRLL